MVENRYFCSTKPKSNNYAVINGSSKKRSVSEQVVCLKRYTSFKSSINLVSQTYNNMGSQCNPMFLSVSWGAADALKKRKEACSLFHSWTFNFMAQLFYCPTVIVQNITIFTSLQSTVLNLYLVYTYTDMREMIFWDVQALFNCSLPFATLNFNCVFRFQLLCTLSATLGTVYNVVVIQQET